MRSRLTQPCLMERDRIGPAIGGLLIAQVGEAYCFQITDPRIDAHDYVDFIRSDGAPQFPHDAGLRDSHFPLGER